MTPGCPEIITVSGSGWSPSTTYDLTIAGPGITGAAGNTATTDATGAISGTNNGWGFLPGQTNAVTTSPPTPGTYTVTMGGLTASYVYDPPEVVQIFLLDTPGCTATSTACAYNIEFVASGFPPDDSLPVSATWNGTAAGFGTTMTTDATGSISLVSAGTTTPVPVGSPSGTATVTVGGVTGTYTVSSGAD